MDQTPPKISKANSRKKRHPKHEEHENHERWLVSYADFITLLFAFFVVLYATSNSDVEKQKQFEKSVRANLNLVTSGGGSGSNKNGLTDIQNAFSELNNPLAKTANGDGDRDADKEAEDYVSKALDKSLGKERRDKNIGEIKHDSLGLRIALKASAFFATGSAKLKPTALKTLDEVANIIKQTERKVIIEGHTDNQFVYGGPFESNWELASNRATTVVRYLIKVHSIDPSRLAAVSYADQKPIAANDNEENRAQNRRIEVLITNSKE